MSARNVERMKVEVALHEKAASALTEKALRVPGQSKPILTEAERLLARIQRSG